MRNHVKAFDQFINENISSIFNRLIIDKEKWLNYSRVNFENQLDDGEIDESMEDYYWDKFKEASLSTWDKITDYLKDDTPVYLELFMPPAWITSRIEQQRWKSIQDLMSQLEELVSNGKIRGTEIQDMRDTEPEWIPILTQLNSEKVVLLIENSEDGQFLSGQAYAIVSTKLVSSYARTQLN